VADERGTLQVPARDLPIPASVSPEARKVLSFGLIGGDEYPQVDDVEGWRAYIAGRQRMMLAGLEPRVADVAADVEERTVAGVPVFVVTPHDLAADDRRVFLELHGGAMVAGGGAVCRAMALSAMGRNGIRTWAVDYRLPPDDPYPAGLDDCVAVYRALLEDHRPEEVIVGGLSAGGNLAAATILRARDEGLPLPAGAVLLTPELDLTESGDSFRANLGLDIVLTRSLMPANLLYAAGADLAHPYLSPLFGDFTRGFPPTLLSAGTRDLFLSNAVRMHQKLRAAGVDAQLHLLEAAPHGGFFGGTPEDLQLDREVRRFVEERTARPWRSADAMRR
jgi:monoterpene epsilon-lactone hydrolase